MTITATAGEFSDTAAFEVTNEHGTLSTDPLTVQEAIAKGNALEAGAKTAKQYYVKGTVYQIDDNSLSKSYNNATFWLYAGEGVKGFEGYRLKPLASVPQADYANFAVGCEVMIVCQITNYVKDGVSTIENSGGNIVSITANSADPTAIDLDSDTLELGVGGTSTLKASLVPAYATGELVWSSSDETIATVDQTGKVTAVAVGDAVITAKFSDEVKATCAVSVKGDVVVENTQSLDLSTDHTTSQTADSVVWTFDNVATMNVARGKKTDGTDGTAANNYLGGLNNRTSSRFYQFSTLTITPATDVTLMRIEFTATTESYASAFANSTFTNATAAASGTKVTVTITDGTQPIVVNIGGTCGFTLVTFVY